MDGVPTVEVKCAQALGVPRMFSCFEDIEQTIAGSEIIAGCSNGELLRFVLQPVGSGKVSVWYHDVNFAPYIF